VAVPTLAGGVLRAGAPSAADSVVMLGSVPPGEASAVAELPWALAVAPVDWHAALGEEYVLLAVTHAAHLFWMAESLQTVVAQRAGGSALKAARVRRNPTVAARVGAQ